MATTENAPYEGLVNKLCLKYYSIDKSLILVWDLREEILRRSILCTS